MGEEMSYKQLVILINEVEKPIRIFKEIGNSNYVHIV